MRCQHDECRFHNPSGCSLLVEEYKLLFDNNPCEEVLIDDLIPDDYDDGSIHPSTVAPRNPLSSPDLPF